ncbi:hypothetical protein A1O1_04083 [Capronia coronata CBS 617.96]|uniref:Uncharacterized protein n=1 Tax=Capronia coronata CBS 617.96 TaxID=1182541 RepID=W9YP23_9EURO|nr:uncharacterized protein A1O1_04083 [Capronia coronata CBS 617.96]EXJ90976.1 hypothetical protein A1O1_04083 [Capronia coronata CBS 617.96]
MHITGTTLLAFATLSLGLSIPEDLEDVFRFVKRQDLSPGSPLYECHAHCGGVIVDARTTNYCTNATYTTDLADCMDCALTYDIWQYYGTDVAKAAEACGDNATPSPSTATAPAAATTAVASSAAAPPSSSAAVTSPAAAPASSSIATTSSAAAAAATSSVVSTSAPAAPASSSVAAWSSASASATYAISSAAATAPTSVAATTTGVAPISTYTGAAARLGSENLLVLAAIGAAIGGLAY